ncbi:MAG TPA: hypothetical protein PLK42_13080, partial [Casimicrobium sp.]|nr:hypothetical protein [Casimicrobium sp.]
GMDVGIVLWLSAASDSWAVLAGWFIVLSTKVILGFKRPLDSRWSMKDVNPSLLSFSAKPGTRKVCHRSNAQKPRQHAATGSPAVGRG